MAQQAEAYVSNDDLLNSLGSDSDQDFEQFAALQRRKMAEAPTLDHGMTPIGAFGLEDEFRRMPYPVPPEREAEIERLHRQNRANQRAEHRRNRIMFAMSCLEGKQGRDYQGMAEEFFGACPPEECRPDILWDFWRRVAWAKAKARGEEVPAQLKPLEQCLAEYNARKISDEYDEAVRRQPPNPKREQQRGGSNQPLFGDEEGIEE